MLVDYWSYSATSVVNSVVDAVAMVEVIRSFFALKTMLDTAGLTLNETRQSY